VEEIKKRMEKFEEKTSSDIILLKKNYELLKICVGERD